MYQAAASTSQYIFNSLNSYNPAHLFATYKEIKAQ